MSFDELRAVVAYGNGEGVVARFPGLLAVACGPDDAVERLLALCRESAGPTPGRGLARRLATWLGDDDGPPGGLRFGTVAATDRGMAVFLSGDVDLLVPEQGVAIAGADAATWTDRLIDTPDAPLALTVAGTAPLLDLVDGVFDLREGAVPGVAVAAVGTLAPDEPDRGEPPNAVPTGDVVRSGAVRAPAATLVFDDGTTFAVDAGYLLGREPDGDARVRSGVLRPITLDDPTGAMSRVHAEIRLEDGGVLLADSGSSNGTFVADPGAPSWTVLAPTRPCRLVPGVRVRLGSRTFTFEAPSSPR
jgi:hypothetical protein